MSAQLYCCSDGLRSLTSLTVWRYILTVIPPSTVST